jgi:hypothetical protein
MLENMRESNESGPVGMYLPDEPGALAIINHKDYPVGKAVPEELINIFFCDLAGFTYKTMGA